MRTSQGTQICFHVTVGTVSHTKHVNTLWRQNAELITVIRVCICILNYRVLKGYDVCTNRIIFKESFLVKFHTEVWKLSMYVVQSFLSRFLRTQTKITAFLSNLTAFVHSFNGVHRPCYVGRVVKVRVSVMLLCNYSLDKRQE